MARGKKRSSSSDNPQRHGRRAYSAAAAYRRPRIIFRIHPCLHLLINNNTHPKRFLGIRCIKRRLRFLHFCKKLPPVRERVPEAVEHVFRLEIPEGLKLEPFADVVFDLLDVMFN